MTEFASPLDRLLSKTRLVAGGCWMWQGYVRRDGYGWFWLRGRNVVAHRAAYQLCVGDIPHGLQLDHLCRNRACVNPDHLEPVTAQVNTLRSTALPAINALKTHCPRGHPYVEDNLLKRSSRNSRECLTCIRDRVRAKYKPRPAKTECRNGHPHSEETTRYSANGKRRCLVCAREQSRRARIKRKSGAEIEIVLREMS